MILRSLAVGAVLAGGLFLALRAPEARQAAPTPSPAGVAAAVETITAEDFHRRIGVIAADSMRGRDTPSPGLEATARYIAEAFRSFGLRPAGDDGSYLQRYSIDRVTPDYDASTLVAEGGPTLRFGADVASPFGPPPSGARTGAVVALPATGDPAVSLEPGALDGLHVVLVPPHPTPSLRSPALLEALRGLLGTGAASILVPVSRSGEAWASDVAVQRETSRIRLPFEDESGPAVLEVREEALATLLASAGADLERLRSAAARAAGPGALPDLRLTLDARLRVLESADAPNVVAVLEGSDPELRDEYVVFSGHMDHVGVGRPDATGDSIYNGADDDASGTVAVMEVAEAFAALETAPRRSLLFLLVSGEEKGLWGSAYFAENPPVPMEDVVADFNTDMVGRNWPDTIVAIGKEHSSLGRTLERVNAAHPELGMTAIDDLWPEESFYTRSDHYNFAREGVPILFFFNGTHGDYHRPSDELDRVDTEKAARIARLVFYLGLEVAQADERPTWNPDSYRRIVEEGGR